MKDRVTLKAEAKALTRSGKESPLLVSAIVLVLAWVLEEISVLLDTGATSFEQLRYMLEHGEVYSMYEETAASSPASVFLTILVSLVTTILYAGYYSYCMGIRRGEITPYSSLLGGLSIAGKVIWCDILIAIRVFLWSLLLFIPGIIAAYRYRFAMYNILRDPSLTASQAIALSCEQTNGMKLDLFVMDLSFLGWNLLASLTLGILNIFVLPYQTLTDLGYYEEAQIRMGNYQEPKYQGPEF